MTKTYVDNAYNRRVGRVGKPLGSAIISPRGGQRMPLLMTPKQELEAISTEKSLNPKGRKLDLPDLKPAVKPLKTYVDNASNRKLGRVGLQYGTKVTAPSVSDQPDLYPRTSRARPVLEPCRYNLRQRKPPTTLGKPKDKGRSDRVIDFAEDDSRSSVDLGTETREVPEIFVNVEVDKMEAIILIGFAVMVLTLSLLIVYATFKHKS